MMAAAFIFTAVSEGNQEPVPPAGPGPEAAPVGEPPIPEPGVLPDPAVAQVPREKLDFLVYDVLRMPSMENEEKPWHFSIIPNTEKVSELVPEVPENASAIIISAQENSPDGNNPDFTAGIAAAEMKKSAVRLGVTISVKTAPAGNMNASQREAFGIPAGYKASAIVLVTDNPGFPGRHPRGPEPDPRGPGAAPAPDPRRPAPDAHHRPAPAPDPRSPAPDARRPGPAPRGPEAPAPAPDPRKPAPDARRPAPDPRGPEAPAPIPGEPAPAPRGQRPAPERMEAFRERINEEIGGYITVVE